MNFIPFFIVIEIKNLQFKLVAITSAVQTFGT